MLEDAVLLCDYFFFNAAQPILLSRLFISGSFPRPTLFFHKFLPQESEGKDL